MNMNMEIRRVIRSNFRAVNIFMNIRNSARIFTNNLFIFGRQMYAYKTSSITVAYRVQTLTAPKKLLNLTVSAYAAAGCSAAELLCWRRYVFRSCCGTLPLGSFRTSRAFEKVSNLSMLSIRLLAAATQRNGGRASHVSSVNGYTISE
jgi:hypothetical protein